MNPAPFNLRCENLTAPLTIAKARPRFSWSLPPIDRPGFAQRAYRIEVEDGSGRPVWDTGMTPGTEPFGVEYAGQKLASFEAYRWRVSFRDEKRDESAASAWAVFETAALSPGDLAGSWISHPDPESYLEGSWESGTPQEKTAEEKSRHYLGIYCWRDVEIEAKPIRRARVLVCGIGLYSLFIDGNPVGDGLLAPDQTDFHVRALYSVLDVTGLLSSGAEKGGSTRHRVTLALGNGRHIALYGFGKPRGYLQLRIDYEDGTGALVVTDGSWKAGHGPIRNNSIFNGETCDARIASPWEIGESGTGRIEGERDAEIIDGPALHPSYVEPIRDDARIRPVSMTETPEGYVFDFGQNFSGCVEISVSVPRGTRLALSHGELVHPDGSLNPASNRAAKATDVYIARGSGPETWRPTFTYHGFRYALLSGYPGVPSCAMLTGVFFHTDVGREGDFRCSLELFNRIHRNILWGQLSNTMGIPTDSPQRDERHGWLGDAVLAAEECLLNFGAVNFYEKFIRDIADTQKPDGSITDVAPRFWMEKPADPAWGSAFISLAWYLYRYKGDRQILERHYDNFRAYVSFLAGKAEGGLIRTLGTFGDWCAPGLVVPRKTSLVFTSTWYYQHDVGLLAKIAGVLSDGESEQRYRALERSIQEAMNDAFLKDSRYESQEISPWEFPDQTSQALALSSTLVPDEKRSAVAATLDRLTTAESGDHVATGIHGSRYILEALTENGYADKAFAIASQESYPGWGYMIREGATTLWERWEKIETVGMNSQNHIMLGSIDVWFYAHVAGIAPEEAGWKTIALHPGEFPSLSYAAADVETPYGHASISWKRKDGRLSIVAVIPPGCAGILRLPEGYSRDSVPKGGASKGQGGDDPERLGSGRHEITAILS